MLNGYNSEGLLESITNCDKSGVKIIYQDGIAYRVKEVQILQPKQFCRLELRYNVQVISRAVLLRLPERLFTSCHCHTIPSYKTRRKNYVMAEFIKLLDEPVPENTVERMMFMAEPEKGRSKSIYFNGYGGKWCHRFADWLAMNAGMSKEMIPNTSNCGKGIVWFAINPNSGGFYFKSAEHKARMICAYSALDGLPYELTEEEQTYVPQPGDYVYFRWENVENRVNVSHVGVVAVATQEYIITWEGNASKKVTQRTCFELFCQGCFHIFLQHAGVGNSRNCIPRHMVAHHRFHPAYTQKAEAVDVTSTASACFLINPAAEKLRCCRSCCHGQSRF